MTLSFVQGLLAEADSIVNDGQWEQLNTLLDRVQNQPNNMKANLKGAIAGESSLSNGDMVFFWPAVPEIDAFCKQSMQLQVLTDWRRL